MAAGREVEVRSRNLSEPFGIAQGLEVSKLESAWEKRDFKLLP